MLTRGVRDAIIPSPICEAISDRERRADLGTKPQLTKTDSTVRNFPGSSYTTGFVKTIPNKKTLVYFAVRRISETILAHAFSMLRHYSPRKQTTRSSERSLYSAWTTSPFNSALIFSISGSTPGNLRLRGGPMSFPFQTQTSLTKISKAPRPWRALPVATIRKQSADVSNPNYELCVT